MNSPSRLGLRARRPHYRFQQRRRERRLNVGYPWMTLVFLLTALAIVIAMIVVLSTFVAAVG